MPLVCTGQQRGSSHWSPLRSSAKKLSVRVWQERQTSEQRLDGLLQSNLDVNAPTPCLWTTVGGEERELRSLLKIHFSSVVVHAEPPPDEPAGQKRLLSPHSRRRKNKPDKRVGKKKDL